MKYNSRAFFVLLLAAACASEHPRVVNLQKTETAPASIPSSAPAKTSPESSFIKPPMPPPPEDVAVAAKSYTMFELMTPKGVNVSKSLFELCAGPSFENVRRWSNADGPHTFCVAMMYMNTQAALAFRTDKPEYPIGSIIIKEKQYMKVDHTKPASRPASKGPMIQIEDKLYPRSELATHGVGGMIKRAPGYDTEHGDWEYFYFEKPGRIESGKIANCVQCHANAADRGYVFGSWNKPEVKDR
ncbi:MAG: cytochrome P460 family protein [Planctomycetes bacterium]|nr:cytochrome P460 family protein [Planctomycetota bacterium]